jgi:hypothetical protein
VAKRSRHDQTPTRGALSSHLGRRGCAASAASLASHAPGRARSAQPIDTHPAAAAAGIQTRVIAFDLGRTNIFIGCERIDGELFVYKLTRCEKYRHNAKLQKRIRRQEDGLPDNVVNARNATFHTADSARLKANLRALFKPVSNEDVQTIDQYLRNHFGTKRWAREHFAQFQQKQRFFDRFFATIQQKHAHTAPNARIIIALGNAKFPAVAKGERSVPTTKAYERLCSFFGASNVCLEKTAGKGRAGTQA